MNWKQKVVSVETTLWEEYMKTWVGLFEAAAIGRVSEWLASPSLPELSTAENPLPANSYFWGLFAIHNTIST